MQKEEERISRKSMTERGTGVVLGVDGPGKGCKERVLS